MQALKKLIELSVKNLKQKFTIYKTDEFQIKKTVDMWAKILSSFILNQNQYYHIFVELDSYFMMNLIFILFVKSLNIFFCSQKKHWHIVFNFEDVSEISSVIYEIYHLWLCIMNQWNHSLKFIQFFIAVDYNV